MIQSVSKQFFGPGVYHLMRDNAPIYIGASSNMANRVRSWSTDSMLADKFDAVEFFPVSDVTELGQAEAAHIARHRPRYNRAGVTLHYVPHGWKLPEPESPPPIPIYRRFADSRRGYIESIEGAAGNPDYVAAQHIKALGLVGPDLSNTELANSVQSLGGPAPVAQRNAGAGVSLFWRRVDVLAWLDDMPGEGVCSMSRKSRRNDRRRQRKQKREGGES